MKITVLNGSPKGDLSVTMQYVNFVQKKFPEHELKIINISNRIKKIQNDDSLFNEIINEVRSSDGILWGFPLYVALVPSQYKRFIELIWEKNASDAFAGKYTAAISTSIHFFDHTAHNYIHAVCDDLDMKYTFSFSPDMFDLMKEKEREKLLIFAEDFFDSIKRNLPTTKFYHPVEKNSFSYSPSSPEKKISTADKKIIVVTDSDQDNSNLDFMINRFKDSFTEDIEIANINKIKINGGCLGCCECGLDYRCVYTGKDEFIDFFNSKLKSADIIIFAAAIRDRYFSSKFKMLFDRAFFNTHTPSLMKKQFGFLISGPFTQIPNIREIMLAFTEWQRANPSGFVSDEVSDSKLLDSLIQNLAEKNVRYSEKGFIKPPTFLGVGGMKIFRDDIWGRLRFVFQADHAFYEKNEFYDFPQDDATSKDINEKMYKLTEDPEMKEKVRKMIKTEMVKPHKHIVETK